LEGAKQTGNLGKSVSREPVYGEKRGGGKARGKAEEGTFESRGGDSESSISREKGEEKCRANTLPGNGGLTGTAVRTGIPKGKVLSDDRSDTEKVFPTPEDKKTKKSTPSWA